MPKRRRSDVIREEEVGLYHLWVRCVRRAWLCGLDPLTGNDYEHRSLLDEGAILAASVDIDLNEIRAQLAGTPEESRHTSIGCRILAHVAREGVALEQGLPFPKSGPESEPEPEKTHEADDWLCPINEQDCAPLLGPAQVESVTTSQALCRMTASSSVETCEPAGSALAQVDAPPSGPAFNLGAARKAWRHGFLPMTEDEYLNFLDWNARQVIPGKSGAMDSSLPPILERIGVAPAFWLKMIENYDRWFRTAVGSAEHLAAEAVRTGRRWLHGIGPMRAASS